MAAGGLGALAAPSWLPYPGDLALDDLALAWSPGTRGAGGVSDDHTLVQCPCYLVCRTGTRSQPGIGRQRL